MRDALISPQVAVKVDSRRIARTGARPGKPERSRATPLATWWPRTTTLVPSGALALVTGIPIRRFPYMFRWFRTTVHTVSNGAASFEIVFTFTRIRRGNVSGHRWGIISGRPSTMVYTQWPNDRSISTGIIGAYLNEHNITWSW